MVIWEIQRPAASISVPERDPARKRDISNGARGTDAFTHIPAKTIPAIYGGLER